MPGDDELLDLLAQALAPAPAEPSLAELTALQNAVRYPLGAGRRWHWRWNRQSIAALIGVGVLATSGTAFAVERDVPPPVNKNPLYQKSKRIFRVGDVYFNKSRTLAVVFFSVYTTPENGTGSWRAFRKATNGQWQTNNSWSTCAWSTSR